MEPDFSGWATKADVKCSDGRIIMPEAFSHMNGKTVPLVWQHNRSQPDNVLGYAVLEARPDGVYAKGFFNETKPGQQAKALVQHGDIKSLSIYANGLVEKSKKVFHGMIRELSLVLSGANPGALIDNVAIRHADGDVETLDDEAIIFTGLELEHAMKTYATKTTTSTVETVDGVTVGTSTRTNESVRTMDDGQPVPRPSDIAYSDTDEDDLEHAEEETVQDVYDSMNDKQKTVVHFMIGAALEEQGSSASQSGIDDDEGDLNHKEGGPSMARNVFDQNKDSGNSEGYSLTHSDIQTIVAEAKRGGSLKEAVERFALSHGIDDIDLLFPDAKTLSSTPDFNKRRTEWVTGVMSGARHSPFSRVKSLVADLTLDEARAKGYVKGALKKEEFFGIVRRTTSPTTVYKKQKLDRDDMLDITDFDVVAWLKGEMRLMLEEEVARAVLIGDGREISDADKVKDPIGAADGAGIRSILNDHELYVSHVNVNVDDANSSYSEVVDAILDGMEFYKGTGTPDFYTTIRTLNAFLKTKDSLGRRLYANKTEVAAALGVNSIITVEPMNDETDLLGIIVNLVDYNIGADRGGEVSFFDDFDIDYNQQKYLTETRLSGALVKIKSAIVVKKVASTDTLLAAPTVPTFVASTGVVTIPTMTHVVYKNAAGDTLSAGAQTALAASGDHIAVVATAASGYYFPNTADTSWTFYRRS
jgi:hypothetical protein